MPGTVKNIILCALAAALFALLPAGAGAGQAADYYRSGNELIEKENYTEAVRALDKAVRLDPSGACGSAERGAAYVNRGIAYLNLGELDKASADFNTALRINPRGRVGLLARKHLGTIATIARDRRMEESARKAEAERGQTNATEHFDNGVSALMRGDFTAAAAGLTKAVELNPGLRENARPYLAQAYARRGEKASRDGEYAGAVADFDLALRWDPDRVNLRAAREEAVRKMDRPKQKDDRAAFGARNAAPPQEAPRDNTLVIALSVGLLVLSGGAYFLYNKYNPDHAAANRELGVQLPGSGPAALSGGNSPGGSRDILFDRRIRELMDAGDYAGALASYAARHPADITAGDKLNLFELHLCLGNYDRAGLVFEDIRGSALLTGNLDLYGRLAELCYEKAQGELALRLSRGIFEAMKQAMDIQRDPEAYYNFARWCEGKGDGALALEIYRLFIGANRDAYQDVLLRFNDLKGRVQAAPPGRAQSGQPFRSGLPAGGTRIGGRYELVGEVGTGGMGLVYRARDERTGQAVAVKRMHSALRESPGEYERFLGEARIVERLKHPGIVSVHGIVEQDGETYLVFDFVDGRTLSDVLKEKRRLPLEECKRIFREVCEAVGYAHRNNIIHRDLKPSNIMLAADGGVKVMDFGLASELRDCMTRVTHQTMSGTPAYMAPEQYTGVVKREADIYAMGVCLYEMLTGELPFAGHEMERLKKERNYQAVSALLPWLPGGTDAVIDRALDPEPSQRYAGAPDFYEALKEIK